jgi:hypothetical protein
MEIIGFISSPINSLIRGKGFAIGFCEKELILKIIPKTINTCIQFIFTFQIMFIKEMASIVVPNFLNKRLNF